MKSFDHYYDEYWRFLKQNGYSENTIDGYLKAIQQTLKGKDLSKLTQRKLDDIALNLTTKYQPNGNRQRFAGINLFCKEILKRKKLHLKIPRSRNKNKDVLTSEQMETLLEIAKERDKKAYVVIQTLYDCALRKNEVCNLDLNDIKFDTMEITLRDTKTGDKIVTMTSRVAEVIKEYLLYERKPKHQEEKALFLSSRRVRIGDHYVRKHLKENAVASGISQRVYTHMLRASCITHLLNMGVNPLTVQQHARHKTFATTMLYNRPTQQQMKADIEKVFVTKTDLNDSDRIRAITDKYLKRELTDNEFHVLLETFRPKQLKKDGELRGYQ
jgi:site-specific recombinase XerD